MRKKTQKVIRLIRECVNAIDPGAEVILYGSRARGDEKPDSDWDLLILTDEYTGVETERKFRDRLYDLELEIDEVFSVFVYSKTDWLNQQRITPFYQNVTQEGIGI